MLCHAWCRSREFHDFLALCLTKNYNQRPTAAELMSHPFVLGHDSLKPIRELLKLAEADVEEVCACACVCVI